MIAESELAQIQWGKIMLYKNIEKVDANIIKTLIDESAPRHRAINKLYERYKGSKKGVPILTREYEIDGKKQEGKINHRISNDFFGEIIDMKVGFFCGVPITYSLDKEIYQTEKEAEKTSKMKIAQGQEVKTETVLSDAYTEDLRYIKSFNDNNQVQDLDLETSKRMSICGYCGRLFYIKENEEQETEERAMIIEPWELIFIGDSIESPDYTIRYYTQIDYADGKKETHYAELYSKDNIQVFVKNDSKGTYDFKEEKEHPFLNNPLIGFANNDELLGDAEKVIALIDFYDCAISDINSELAQWRLAYLLLTGCSMTADQVKEARQTGAISLPLDGADAKFLTKDIVDAVIEHHLDRLENNIYKFSKTPNMNDKFFGGNLTGVAIKEKFRPFEDKCKVAELKYKKALNSQWDLLTGLWREKGIDIDPDTIIETFQRNYPQNKVEEAAFLRDTKGIISEETRFRNSILIEDPEKEKQMLADEETVNLDNFILRNEMMAKDGGEQKKELTDNNESVKNQGK